MRTLETRTWSPEESARIRMAFNWLGKPSPRRRWQQLANRKKERTTAVWRPQPGTLKNGRIRVDWRQRRGTTKRVRTTVRLRPPPADPSGKNTITARRTAWKIAGRQYKAATTLYRFPEGRSLRGHEIRDWSDIPSGTVVELGVEEDKVVSAVRAEVLLPIVGENMSPWKIANVLHNSSFTYYLYPGGKILAGHRIERFADVPSGTRVLIAYRRVPTPRTSDPLGEDLDDDYLSHQTLYLLPGGVLQSGEQIENFAQLPRGAIVFSKVE